MIFFVKQLKVKFLPTSNLLTNIEFSNPKVNVEIKSSINLTVKNQRV